MFLPMVMASGSSANDYTVNANQRFPRADSIHTPIDYYQLQAGPSTMLYVPQLQQIYQGYAGVGQENLVPFQEWNHHMNYYQGQRVENGDFQQWDHFWKVPYDQKMMPEVPVQNHTQEPAPQQFQGHAEVPIQMVQNQMGAAVVPTQQPACHLNLNQNQNAEYYWQDRFPAHALVNQPQSHQSPQQFTVSGSSQFQGSPVPHFDDTHNQSAPAPTGPPTITLNNLATWGDLFSHTNEMLVTLNGRQINPRINISIGNTKRDTEYEIRWKLMLTSVNKFQYKKGQWREMIGEKTDARLEAMTIEMKKGWVTGEKLEAAGSHELAAKIYSIGSGKKAVPLEQKKGKARARAIKAAKDKGTKMFCVVPQHKYAPVISLFEKTLGGEVLVARLCHEETEFLAKTGCRNKKLSRRKAVINKFCRKDYKENRKINEISNFFC